MTWTEIRSNDNYLNDTKSFLEKKFSKIYTADQVGNDTVFSLPDGLEMTIFILHGKAFNCLGMNYRSETDNEDGDLYYPEDFETPDDMFTAMLEETQR